jgi:hypothetical protein
VRNDIIVKSTIDHNHPVEDKAIVCKKISNNLKASVAASAIPVPQILIILIKNSLREGIWSYPPLATPLVMFLYIM